MNKYYHEFTISFNWWMIIAPVMMVFAVAVVLFIVYSRKEIKERFFGFVAGILATIWTVIFIIESHNGVIQWFDNNSDAFTHGAWSEILCYPAMIIVGLFFAAILVKAMKVSYRYASCFVASITPRKNHRDIIERLKARKEFDSIVDELNKVIDESEKGEKK